MNSVAIYGIIIFLYLITVTFKKRNFRRLTLENAVEILRIQVLYSNYSKKKIIFFLLMVSLFNRSILFALEKKTHL